MNAMALSTKSDKSPTMNMMKYDLNSILHNIFVFVSLVFLFCVFLLFLIEQFGRKKKKFRKGDEPSSSKNANNDDEEDEREERKPARDDEDEEEEDEEEDDDDEDFDASKYDLSEVIEKNDKK